MGQIGEFAASSLIVRQAAIGNCQSSALQKMSYPAANYGVTGIQKTGDRSQEENLAQQTAKN